MAIESVLGARLALGDHLTVAVDVERRHPRAAVPRGAAGAADARALPVGRQADALRVFQAMRVGAGRGARHRSVPSAPSPRGADPPPGSRSRPAAAGRHAGGGVGARVENPYMGLRAFRESDAARFFGQDRLIAQLAARVSSTATFTAVVGPSGPGKSSVVQAGLLPQVRARVAEHRASRRSSLVRSPSPSSRRRSAAWRGTSAASILTALRATERGTAGRGGPTARRPTASRLLLVVDQFEELFTLTRPTRPRRSSPRCRRRPMTPGAASRCS